MELKVSDQITLRAVGLDDVEDIFRTIDTQRDYLGEWLPFVTLTQSVDFTRSFIQSILDTPFEVREHTFVVLYEGEFAGLVGFRDTDRANRKTEIGYWLSESYQHKGIVTKAVQTLITFAFEAMSMNRVQIRCAVGNAPSRRIPIRLGFQLEGVERAGELFPDGRFRDLEVYSLLKNELDNAM
ncbi:MAG: GNAT family N-acetyltransferase [Bacteroidales bacterium]|jgi:ribosomal-protein-serine acetyltransferase|nr:GNAT family N-acetyltransferase [Bacteroidales bacterium]OPZ95510.1 MAG: putative ribosomal N-acetyltransferase YdaF [Bacteroidetes bacterium ADurb.Bin416]